MASTEHLSSAAETNPSVGAVRSQRRHFQRKKDLEDRLQSIRQEVCERMITLQKDFRVASEERNSADACFHGAGERRLSALESQLRLRDQNEINVSPVSEKIDKLESSLKTYRTTLMTFMPSLRILAVNPPPQC